MTLSSISFTIQYENSIKTECIVISANAQRKISQIILPYVAIHSVIFM